MIFLIILFAIDHVIMVCTQYDSSDTFLFSNNKNWDSRFIAGIWKW